MQFWHNNSIRVVCLQCREVFERHFAVNIQRWINEAMDQYGISEDQLIAITIDSGANVTRAVDDLILDLEDGDQEPNEIPVDFNDLLETDEYEETDEDEDQDFELEAEDEVDPELENVVVELKTTRVHCAAHKLQLAVNGYLLKDETNLALVVLAQKTRWN